MERSPFTNPEKRIPTPEGIPEEVSHFEWEEEGRVLRRINQVTLPEKEVVSENANEPNREQFGPRTEAQNIALRNALALIGVLAAQTAPDYGDASRRIAAKETEITYKTDSTIESVFDFLTPREKNSLRSPEEETLVKENPAFYTEVSGYVARGNLRFDEVQFVDATNCPIGKPVKLESFTIERGGTPYLVTPGVVNELGIVTKGISKEWLTEMRQRILREHPDAGEVGVLSVAAHFDAALETTDEPDLVAGIANGSIVTYKQLVDFYLNKSVIGTEHISRRDYIEERIKFSDNVPAVAQEEFRRLVVGLAMQETGGNNGLVSHTGAQGIFQFQPTTWAEQGGKPEEIRSLKRQVQVAGLYLSTLYRQVQHFAGEDAMKILHSRYSEDEVARDILVPLSINAYNAGASRLGEAVKVYFQNQGNMKKNLKGKDLFLDIINYASMHREGKLAAFGGDAHEYTLRVTANSMVMRNEHSPSKVNANVTFNF